MALSTYVVGYCHPGTLDSKFHDSIVNLVQKDARGESRGPRLHSLVGLLSGPQIAKARNELVQHFLRTDASWLLMVDADISFEEDDVERLLAAGHSTQAPVVSGLYFGRHPGTGELFPTIYRLVPTEDNNPVECIRDFPPNRTCKIDACGAGFLLMHRKALEKMGEAFAGSSPWFSEGTTYKGLQFSEDWAFCLRCQSLDIPVYVHTGVTVGHMKTMELTAATYAAQRAAEREVVDA